MKFARGFSFSRGITIVREERCLQPPHAVSPESQRSILWEEKCLFWMCMYDIIDPFSMVLPRGLVGGFCIAAEGVTFKCRSKTELVLRVD